MSWSFQTNTGQSKARSTQWTGAGLRESWMQPGIEPGIEPEIEQGIEPGIDQGRSAFRCVTLDQATA